ncbi:hypothetical protein JYU34_022007 [Plutella xylostella]|uniref:Uncharacterized protein n=1 Tax=Plutella xylostella TaxID=51655 RepID=A0ABQ7PSF1_PLUXY|nr:hypothetical protein JYU34_022007 [Plutella xylostella]
MAIDNNYYHKNVLEVILSQFTAIFGDMATHSGKNLTNKRRKQAKGSHFSAGEIVYIKPCWLRDAWRRAGGIVNRCLANRLVYRIFLISSSSSPPHHSACLDFKRVSIRTAFGKPDGRSMARRWKNTNKHTTPPTTTGHLCGRPGPQVSNNTFLQPEHLIITR